MANVADKRVENANGDFFVDESCIDCGTCMWMEPAVFHEDGGMSSVHTQPETTALKQSALRALVSCPTASIGVTETKTRGMLKDVIQSAPFHIEDNVFHCGFHAESSFGAASYFIRRDDGNIMIDSPRFAAPLVKRINELGGIKTLFLTHRDDVADHEKWRAEFDCERIIMAGDARGLSVETKLKGDAPVQLADDLTVIPTPGHTRGSACLHYGDKFLFAGDHLAWSKRLGHLYAFRRACWYDWGEVVRSLRRLEGVPFEWVLPGHGWPVHDSLEGTNIQMRQCIEWAESD